jgi:hypothetical protein
MKNIKRQFGAKFAETLAKSPTLVRDVAEMRKRGIKIRRIRSRNIFHAQHSTKTAYIGPGHVVDQLSSLGHELTHLLRGKTVVQRFNEAMYPSQFIEAFLDEETTCEMHGTLIVDELLSAGVAIPAQSKHVHRVYKKGGRKQIRFMVECSIVDYTGEYYPEFYRRVYEQQVRKLTASKIKQLRSELSNNAEAKALAAKILKLLKDEEKDKVARKELRPLIANLFLLAKIQRAQMKVSVATGSGSNTGSK